MLREHYCGSLTFREQRNTIENLRQKPQEAAIDFLIRVGISVSNLGNDWKDELTDEELHSLQYEVSLNGVHEEIRHVLDSEIAKNGGNLTPQQMYEAVKRYETYVARNKGSKAKVPARPPASQRPLATPMVTSRDFIKPWLSRPQSLRLRMMAQAVMSLRLRKGPMPMAMSRLKKMTKGCSSPAIWRRLYPMIWSSR